MVTLWFGYSVASRQACGVLSLAQVVAFYAILASMMMQEKRRRRIILLSIVGAPTLFIGLGLFSTAFFDDFRPQYKGTGPGLEAWFTWASLAVLALLIGSILGVLVNNLLEGKGKPKLELMGYILTPIVLFIVGITSMVNLFFEIR